MVRALAKLGILVLVVAFLWSTHVFEGIGYLIVGLIVLPLVLRGVWGASGR